MVTVQGDTFIKDPYTVRHGHEEVAVTGKTSFQM